MFDGVLPDTLYPVLFLNVRAFLLEPNLLGPSMLVSANLPILLFSIGTLFRAIIRAAGPLPIHCSST